MSGETDSERQDRLEAVLHAYLQAVDAGNAPSSKALIAQHPDLADELSAFLADQARLDRAARQMTPDRDAQATLASGTTPGPARPLGVVRYIGDYELMEEIARGGMGVVYKARQYSLGRIVALKMILAGSHASELDLARFKTEAEAVARLQHPHVVPVLSSGEAAGLPWFTMPFVEGVTIDRIVRGAHGPLVVLDDGVVSLDGTDGTEIWSYRDPAARDAAVWVGNGQVLFTRVPERDEDAAEQGGNAPEEQFTRVFDMVDGELVTEFSADTGEASRGGARTLVGWSDGVRVHSDRRDGGEPDEAPGMSAWDAESGEELWYRDPAPEPGAAVMPAMDSGSAPDPSGVENLLEALYLWADGEPGRPQVILRREDGNEQVISYGELARRSAAVAADLGRLGVGPGER